MGIDYCNKWFIKKNYHSNIITSRLTINKDPNCVWILSQHFKVVSVYIKKLLFDNKNYSILAARISIYIYIIIINTKKGFKKCLLNVLRFFKTKY